MKKIIINCVVMLLGAAAGCGSGASSDKCAAVSCGAGMSCDSATGTCISKCASVTCNNGQVCEPTTAMCANPPAPSVATLAVIDRMGRPAVNTALTNPFGFFKNAGQTETSDAAKDRYNKDGNAAAFVASWSPAIKFHLGIFDALDNTCGNQAFYATAATGTAKYDPLASVLAGDVIHVDTSKSVCTAYLGVETASATDCGGRKLEYDVIDTTYTVLVTGTVPFGDTIAQVSVPDATFPFMKNPS